RLGQVTLPAIAHLRDGHYVVLHELRPGGVVVGDPAAGIVTWDRATLTRCYSGALLLFGSPTAAKPAALPGGGEIMSTTGPGRPAMAEASDRTAHIQACLDRLRGGDEAARAELLGCACERLLQLARKMLKGYPNVRRWEQTDDVLQNAFLRLD